MPAAKKKSIFANPTVMAQMDKWDMYGSKVYTYNFEGRSNINSLMGVITSILVYIFVINFLVTSTIGMIKGANPTVSS